VAPSSGIEVLFQGSNLARLLGGLGVSVAIAAAALALSILVGLPIGVLMSSKRRFLGAILRWNLEFVRVMPQLVLLFVFFFYVSGELGLELSGQVAAVVVFAYWGAAELGDLVRGAMASVPVHQFEAGYALGLTKRQVQTRIVLPLCLRLLLPAAVNLATRMIKTTSLVVLIGVVEVLKIGQQIVDRSRFDYPDAALWVYGVIFALYFLVCYPLSRFAARLEGHIA
jgi:polar amino acid transport system permease protein